MWTAVFTGWNGFATFVATAAAYQQSERHPPGRARSSARDATPKPAAQLAVGCDARSASIAGPSPIGAGKVIRMRLKSGLNSSWPSR